MTESHQPSEPEIQRWIGEPSFGRGRRYYQQGRIHSPRRQGLILKALCAGSRAEPYRVEATLESTGIASAHCSCPVGDWGSCKHVAALLLTWCHDPDCFQEIKDRETALAERTQPELIELIKLMIKRYPDLDVLLELLPACASGPDRQLDPELVLRQVHDAFNRARDDWGAVSAVYADLDALLGLADRHALRGAWVNAEVVYGTVAKTVLDRFFEIRDDEGELSHIVSCCVQGLGRCLEAADQPARRHELMRSLFDIYRWDAEVSGYDLGYEVPAILLNSARDDERRLLSTWVEEALASGADKIGRYHRQAYGGLILGLREAELDDEAYLQICRRTGRLGDLIDRLLALDRVQEAVAEAARAPDYQLLPLADRFVEHRYADSAELLVRERASQSASIALKTWLLERAKFRGDVEQALAFAEVIFWRALSTAAYQEMRDLALSLGRWDALRQRCLTHLEIQGRYTLLTKLHLLEGDSGQALVTLEDALIESGWSTGDLEHRVAQAAEQDHPREAIRLYSRLAEGLIQARGRGNYAEAAAYLVRVRDLYDRLGDPAAWQIQIAGLRDKHRRLRAMQDEFNQAGLP